MTTTRHGYAGSGGRMPGLLNTWVTRTGGPHIGACCVVWPHPQPRRRAASTRLHETDDQLLDLQRRLWDLMEHHRPHPEATAADRRLYFKIFDALFRVFDTRCRLHGLYAQPWRYDRCWRRDVPAVVCVPLQRRANQLGREARIPLRCRSPAGAPRELAPVVPLPVPMALVDVDSLVSPAVRRLLEAG